MGLYKNILRRDTCNCGYTAIPFVVLLYYSNLYAMEILTFPVLTLLSPIIGWLIWLTIKTFQNDKAIAINTTNDSTVKSQITEVKTDMTMRIDKLENHFDVKFEQVNNKIDRIFESIMAKK